MPMSSGTHFAQILFPHLQPGRWEVKIPWVLFMHTFNNEEIFTSTSAA